MNNGDNNFYTNNSFYSNATDPTFDEQYSVRKTECDKLSSRCLVFGIISLALVLTCPCLPTFVLAIVSLYYYSKAKKLLDTPKLGGNLLAGMICSIVSLVYSGLYFMIMLVYVFMIVFFGTLGVLAG